MTSVDEIVLALKHQPASHTIHQALRSYADLLSPSAVEQLLVVSVLLKHTVVEVYMQLPHEIQQLLAQCMLNIVGLGNTVATIQMLINLKADTSYDTAGVIDAYTHLLDRMLAPGLVLLCLSKWAPSQGSWKEVDKLLYMGKCFAVLRELSMRNAHAYIPPVCRDASAYASFLSRELVSLNGTVEVSIINSFTHSLMAVSAHSAHQFFDVMFSSQNLPQLATSIRSMKRFERKIMLFKVFHYLQVSYLKSPMSMDNDYIAALTTLLKHCFDCSIWDLLMCDQVVAKYSHQLNLTAALMARSGLDDPNYSSLVVKALNAWGNASLIAEEPIVKQGFRTHMLLSLCCLCSTGTLQEVLKQTAFVSAMTNRLSSKSERAKSLGVYLADELCTYAQQDKIFSLGTSALGVAFPHPVTSIRDMSVPDAWEIVSAPHVEEADPDVGMDELQKKLKPVSLQEESSYAVKDATMSDEEDDPTMSSGPPVLPPIYVKELLSYLSVDKKDQQAYEKRRVALATAPTLLRQKSGFGNEVSFYAEDLLSLLAGLTNQFEDHDFEQLKLNALIGVVVSYPLVTTHLCHLLLTGDYSLQQRLCLLSAMSLSCRELKGYKDDAVFSSYKQERFASKQLPQKLHEQYLALQGEKATFEDYGYRAIEGNIQNELLHEASETAKDEIAGGRILRMSASLRKKEPSGSETLVVSKEAQDTFKKTVGKQFFFPLVALWYQSGGFNIGPYTEDLVSHYIKTLSLILHAAYPTALDINDMAGEFCGILVDVLPGASRDHIGLLESLATGAFVVLDVLEDEFVVSQLHNQVSAIDSYFTSIWDSIIDERVKSLCAGLLLRINDLRAKFERVIMDQMNRGFI